MAHNFRICPGDKSSFPSGCVLSLVSSSMWAVPLITTCSTWHINSRIYWISLNTPLGSHPGKLFDPLFNENISTMLRWLRRFDFGDTVKCVYRSTRRTLWMSFQAYKTLYIRRSLPLRHRGPHMGDAWEPFLFRSADPGRVRFFFSFFRGNSSCLAALIQAGWLYLHTYCGKEACSNSRKGSRFVFSRSETSWCNQLQLGLSCTGARCSMPLSVAHHMVSRAMETHVTRSLKIWLTNQNRQYYVSNYRTQGKQQHIYNWEVKADNLNIIRVIFCCSIKRLILWAAYIS